MLGIGIEQSPDHPLILCVVSLRFGLEEFDTTLAQGNGDFDPFVLKHKILGAGQKVSDDFGISQRLVCVLDFRAHRFVCIPFKPCLGHEEKIAQFWVISHTIIWHTIHRYAF